MHVIRLFLAPNLHASTGLCVGTWKMRWSRRDGGVTTSRFGFRNIDGFGLVFLDVNHLLWYGFCCILVPWCVLIGFQSG